MADDVFKLPKSSYETVCRIVQAYTQVGDKTDLSTISKILGNDATVVSRNVAFLVSVGLLEGGSAKGPTAAGVRLGRALEFNETGDIAAAWREVLSNHTLIQRILSAIRVRGGMETGALQGQIVYTAGVNKNAGSMTGGLAVVEMLKAAELIVERDGRFIVPSATEAVAPATTADVDEVAAEPSPRPLAPLVQRVIETSDGGVTVRVDLRISINAGADELPAVGVGIRQLLDELRNTEPDLDYEDVVDDELT